MWLLPKPPVLFIGMEYGFALGCVLLSVTAAWRSRRGSV